MMEAWLKRLPPPVKDATGVEKSAGDRTIVQQEFTALKDCREETSFKQTLQDDQHHDVSSTTGTEAGTPAESEMPVERSEKERAASKRSCDSGNSCSSGILGMTLSLLSGSSPLRFPSRRHSGSAQHSLDNCKQQSSSSIKTELQSHTHKAVVEVSSDALKNKKSSLEHRDVENSGPSSQQLFCSGQPMPARKLSCSMSPKQSVFRKQIAALDRSENLSASADRLMESVTVADLETDTHTIVPGAAADVTIVSPVAVASTEADEGTCIPASSLPATDVIACDGYQSGGSSTPTASDVSGSCHPVQVKKRGRPRKSILIPLPPMSDPSTRSNTLNKVEVSETKLQTLELTTDAQHLQPSDIFKTSGHPDAGSVDSGEPLAAVTDQLSVQQWSKLPNETARGLEDDLNEAKPTRIKKNDPNPLRHLQVFTRDSQYKGNMRCCGCIFSTPYVNKFRQHLSREHNLKLFECSLCSYSSFWKQNVRFHIRKLHPGTDIEPQRMAREDQIASCDIPRELQREVTMEDLSDVSCTSAPEVTQSATTDVLVPEGQEGQEHGENLHVERNSDLDCMEQAGSKKCSKKPDKEGLEAVDSSSFPIKKRGRPRKLRAKAPKQEMSSNEADAHKPRSSRRSTAGKDKSYLGGKDIQHVDKDGNTAVPPTRRSLSRFYRHTSLSDSSSKVCVGCDVEFEDFRFFYRHLNSRHKVKRFQCFWCEHRVLFLWEMKVHMKQCHPLKKTRKIRVLEDADILALSDIPLHLLNYNQSDNAEDDTNNDQEQSCPAETIMKEVNASSTEDEQENIFSVDMDQAAAAFLDKGVTDKIDMRRGKKRSFRRKQNSSQEFSTPASQDSVCDDRLKKRRSLLDVKNDEVDSNVFESKSQTGLKDLRTVKELVHVCPDGGPSQVWHARSSALTDGDTDVTKHDRRPERPLRDFKESLFGKRRTARPEAGMPDGKENQFQYNPTSATKQAKTLRAGTSAPLSNSDTLDSNGSLHGNTGQVDTQALASAEGVANTIVEEPRKEIKVHVPFYRCCVVQKCAYSTSKYYLMKEHVRKHLNLKPFKCGYCPVSKRYDSEMRIHLRNSHSKKKVSFTRTEPLEWHEKIHELSMKCEVKGNSEMSSDGRFQKLLNTETNDKKIKEKLESTLSSRSLACPHCDYAVESDYNILYKHLSKVHDIKRFQCSSCSFQSFYKCKVRKHCNLVHGEKDPSVVSLKHVDSGQGRRITLTENHWKNGLEKEDDAGAVGREVSSKNSQEDNTINEVLLQTPNSGDRQEKQNVFEKSPEKGTAETKELMIKGAGITGDGEKKNCSKEEKSPGKVKTETKEKARKVSGCSPSSKSKSTAGKGQNLTITEMFSRMQHTVKSSQSNGDLSGPAGCSTVDEDDSSNLHGSDSQTKEHPSSVLYETLSREVCDSSGQIPATSMAAHSDMVENEVDEVGRSGDVLEGGSGSGPHRSSAPLSAPAAQGTLSAPKVEKFGGYRAKPFVRKRKMGRYKSNWTLRLRGPKLREEDRISDAALLTRPSETSIGESEKFFVDDGTPFGTQPVESEQLNSVQGGVPVEADMELGVTGSEKSARISAKKDARIRGHKIATGKSGLDGSHGQSGSGSIVEQVPLPGRCNTQDCDSKTAAVDGGSMDWVKDKGTCNDGSESDGPEIAKPLTRAVHKKTKGGSSKDARPDVHYYYRCGWCKFRGIQQATIARHHAQKHKNIPEVDIVILKRKTDISAEGSPGKKTYSKPGPKHGRHRNRPYRHVDIGEEKLRDILLRQPEVQVVDLMRSGLQYVHDLLPQFGVTKVCMDLLSEEEFVLLATDCAENATYNNSNIPDFAPIELGALEDSEIARLIREAARF